MILYGVTRACDDGACILVCPQAINIPDVMQKLDVKLTELRKEMEEHRRQAEQAKEEKK